MGRYDFAPQRVQTYASQLLQNKRISTPPPWYGVITTVPPSERLTRPPMQRAQKAGARAPKSRKASRTFKPLRLQYEEEALRWEYFNDHPWELARPRVVLEDQGRDSENWDWSLPLDYALERPRQMVSEMGVPLESKWDWDMESQAGRPINGEAVVRRQQYLLSQGYTPASAYDTARKEFYRFRHHQEISSRVAREEALAVGAFFGPGPLEIGMHLEDQQYEAWKAWAIKEAAAVKQMRGSMYSGVQDTADDGAAQIDEPEAEDNPGGF